MKLLTIVRRRALRRVCEQALLKIETLLPYMTERGRREAKSNIADLRRRLEEDHTWHEGDN